MKRNTLIRPGCEKIVQKLWDEYIEKSAKLTTLEARLYYQNRMMDKINSFCKYNVQ